MICLYRNVVATALVAAVAACPLRPRADSVSLTGLMRWINGRLPLAPYRGIHTLAKAPLVVGDDGRKADAPGAQLAALARRFGPQPPVTCTTHYFVLEGQTCQSIASSVAISVDQLMEYNPNIDCNVLYPTQELCVAPACVENCPTSTLSSAGCTKVYQIKPGDSCWSIATGFGVTVEYLQAVNPSLSCYRVPIYPQDTLCVVGPGYPFADPTATFA